MLSAIQRVIFHSAYSLSLVAFEMPSLSVYNTAWLQDDAYSVTWLLIGKFVIIIPQRRCTLSKDTLLQSLTNLPLPNGLRVPRGLNSLIDRLFRKVSRVQSRRNLYQHQQVQAV